MQTIEVVPEVKTLPTAPVVHEDQPAEVVFETTISPPINIDEECALATKFDGGLIPTEEVVGSLSNEPNLEADFDRVWAWTKWRIPKIGE